jgi:hypothetical protein
MKHLKKVFFVLTAATVLTAPISVFAATSDSNVVTGYRGYCNLGIASNLTDEQKADWEAACNQIMEIRKESINKMVQDGLITQEQGELELNRLDDMIKYHEEYGYGTGMMNGSGYTQDATNHVGYGRGMMGGRFAR